MPTVLIGIFVLFYFTDRPAQARWLTPMKSGWLCAEIDGERRADRIARASSASARSFWDPKVLLLALNYFGIVTASLGLLLFLPQIVKQLGATNMQVGWATMLPYTLRRDQHGGLGLDLRPHGRAALEPVLGLHARRRRAW